MLCIRCRKELDSDLYPCRYCGVIKQVYWIDFIYVDEKDPVHNMFRKRLEWQNVNRKTSRIIHGSNEDDILAEWEMDCKTYWSKYSDKMQHFLIKDTREIFKSHVNKD